MISYRQELDRIKELDRTKGTARPHSYRTDFTSWPPSLRAAIASMRAPTSQDWRKVKEVPLKTTSWTNACNGVAWHNGYFIFSSNASGDKALYSFRADGGHTDKAKLADGAVVHKFPFAGRVDRALDHIGQVSSFEGKLYVSHFKGMQSCIFVLTHSDSGFTFERTIDLPLVDRRKVEFLAINPWNRMIYTAWGDGLVDYVIIHDLDGTERDRMPLLGRTLQYQDETGLNTDQYPVQGGFFSDNGHLYIASNVEVGTDNDKQPIFYYSALNGQHMGEIQVDAQRSSTQELQGPCSVGSQVCVVLLETNLISDNVWFKQYEATDPSVV